MVMMIASLSTSPWHSTSARQASGSLGNHRGTCSKKRMIWIDFAARRNVALWPRQTAPTALSRVSRRPAAPAAPGSGVALAHARLVVVRRLRSQLEPFIFRSASMHLHMHNAMMAGGVRTCPTTATRTVCCARAPPTRPMTSRKRNRRTGVDVPIPFDAGGRSIHLRGCTPFRLGAIAFIASFCGLVRPATAAAAAAATASRHSPPFERWSPPTMRTKRWSTLLPPPSASSRRSSRLT